MPVAGDLTWNGSWGRAFFAKKMGSNQLKFLWQGNQNETITLAMIDERDLKDVLF